jgi:CO/xanthine dehydrogenase FAD-binding subunit
VNTFSYTRAGDVATAVREVASAGAAKFIAGGTNLIDLMQENVERPSRLINITRLPLAEIRPSSDGGLRLGALVTNTDVAYDVADALLRDAKGFGHNNFKIELAKRAIGRALRRAIAGEEHP